MLFRQYKTVLIDLRAGSDMDCIKNISLVFIFLSGIPFRSVYLNIVPINMQNKVNEISTEMETIKV